MIIKKKLLKILRRIAEEEAIRTSSTTEEILDYIMKRIGYYNSSIILSREVLVVEKGKLWRTTWTDFPEK